VQIRVYYEDTDAGGVVYHTNYIKYCERARSELFFSNDRPVSINDCHFVIKHLEADFVKPARLGDLLDVKTKLVSHKKTSMVIHHEIYKGETLLFKAELLAVYVDVTIGQPKRIDEETLAFLRNQ